MARLTPNDILGLSEPIELVYSNIVDSLLVNMARHFNSGHSLSTQEWEIRKLAELGQLNRESMEIIANLTGQNPALMQTALENAVYAATKDIEPELKKGVKAGAIDPPAADNVIASKSVSQALKAYDAQALDKLNLVNTTMLQSTLDQYRKVIVNTVNIERQMQASQAILNAAAGKVVAGTESRTAALRQALSQIHAEGITGFIDRAGRRWSPEAYVNMDIRTTVHNTAIEAVKLRQQDYGVEIFRVSRHSGARPLCYPYQGRYFSWNNKSGTFTDGEGKRHRYAPISSTSYGKPAGLFGINCGHHPITVIPGVSIPRDMPEQSKEENDRIYAGSQQQRKLERDIRYAKQKAAMLDAAGDKEGFANEAAKVKQRQAAYNAFCKETGRTKRLDRTQVFDYNKDVSRRATAAYNDRIHTQYKGYLGTKTAQQTVAKVKSITDNGDKWLLDGYTKAVDKGDISALVGIDTYLSTAREIERNLVGTSAVNGLEIKGYTTHFVDRVIGQTSTSHAGMRTGVSVEDALDTLLHGQPQPITIRKNGKRSQKFKGQNNAVTVNPDTGLLIQTNPRGE